MTVKLAIAGALAVGGIAAATMRSDAAATSPAPSSALDLWRSFAGLFGGAGELARGDVYRKPPWVAAVQYGGAEHRFSLFSVFTGACKGTADWDPETRLYRWVDPSCEVGRRLDDDDRALFATGLLE